MTKAETYASIPADWLAEFDAEVHYELPIFAAGSRIPPDKDTVRKQVLAFLERIHEKVARRHVAELVELGSEWSEVWRRVAYGASEPALQEQREFMRSFLLAKENVIDPFDANSLHIEVGKTLVMVYTGFHGRLNNPHLFTYTANGQKIYSQHARLAYIGKKWVWWD